MLHTCTKNSRPGVVLLAVLVVLVLLTLAAWQYTDLMMAEYQASNNAHRQAQVKALADAGVQYAAALLSNPENVEQVLNGNPYNNPDAFANVVVRGADGNPAGTFTLIAPVDPNDDDGSGAYRHGVIDETGKINLNAMMKKDTSGDKLHEMLIKLPNMTDEIAAAIVDWIDPDNEVRANGAEDEHYTSQSPPYRAKNGPLDSLDELLLVSGVTHELLYGSDRNRNGSEDPGESGVNGFERGWSAFLTIYSREQDLNTAGIRLDNVNGDDLETLYDLLGDQVTEDMAKFVVLYRQYGPSNTKGSRQSAGRTILSALGLVKKAKEGSSPAAVPGKLGDFEIDFEKTAKQKLKSLFDLVDTQVTVPAKVRGQPATLYSSPLNDSGPRRDLLSKLFETVSVFDQTDIPARININTAPAEVLAALPELTPAEVDTILALRPKYAYVQAPEPVYQSPAWLLTEAHLTVSTLRNIEKLVTTRSQVFQVQVLGYLDEKGGPAARIEAVIDTNAGRPRIIAWRDLSQLGRTARPGAR